MANPRSVPPLSEAEPLSDGSFGAEEQALPLPAGMRDLLPEEATRHAEVVSRLMRSFGLYGYSEVGLPLFEYAAVLERGLGGLGAGDVLRFVEPETGEVVVLRPDMTPQVARLVASRFADAPLPLRVAYRGSVLRRRRERARRHRQIPQVGVELIGSAGPAGDLEVIEAATVAVRAAGLPDFTLDLGHARLATELMEGVAEEHWPDLIEALHVKDATTLERRATALGLPPRQVGALSALPGLHGGPEVLGHARRALVGTKAEPALLELWELVEQVQARSLASSVLVDLGETRDFNYYSGPLFSILAEGPGEPIGTGGRYDGLLGRFGSPRAAAGFAVDVANLDWALVEASRVSSPTCVALADGDGQAALAAALRALGIAAAILPAASVHAALENGSFSHALVWEQERLLLKSKPFSPTVLDGGSPGALAQAVREKLGTER